VPGPLKLSQRVETVAAIANLDTKRPQLSRDYFDIHLCVAAISARNPVNCGATLLRTGNDVPAGISGISNVKTDPMCSRLETEIVPPIRSTNCRQMARPRPEPPYRRGDRAVGLAKFLEQALAYGIRHADAGVSHLKAQRRRRFGATRSAQPILIVTLPDSVNLIALPIKSAKSAEGDWNRRERP